MKKYCDYIEQINTVYDIVIQYLQEALNVMLMYVIHHLTQGQEVA